MDNQHRKIKGYRELSPTEIALMNEIKDRGAALEQLVQTLRQVECIDQRWVSEGNMDLQKGIMCLVRSVARPTSF